MKILLLCLLNEYLSVVVAEQHLAGTLGSKQLLEQVEMLDMKFLVLSTGTKAFAHHRKIFSIFDTIVETSSVPSDYFPVVYLDHQGSHRITKERTDVTPTTTSILHVKT